MRRKTKCWSRSAGRYGAKVRVSEVAPGGNLYLIWVDGEGKQRKRSLGHKDRRRGYDEAVECAASLARRRDDVEAARMTMDRLFDNYCAAGLTGRSVQYQREAQRKLARWVEFLGPRRTVETLGRRDIRAFAEARNAAAKAAGRTLSQTTHWHDFVVLNTALNFAVGCRDSRDRRVLAVNPLDGVSVPKTVSPAQPVATADSYERLREVGNQVGPMFVTLLDLAHSTGHRIGAILQLRWRDITFEASAQAPYGTIHWRMEHDKIDNDHVLPMNEVAHLALLFAKDRAPAQAEDGDLVFASSSSPSRPIDRRLVSRWLRRALKLSGIRAARGFGWHAFRRGWATDRKHLPDADVAYAGGWKDEATMKRCYQHADPAGVLRVIVTGAGSLAREDIQRVIPTA